MHLESHRLHDKKSDPNIYLITMLIKYLKALTNRCPIKKPSQKIMRQLRLFFCEN